MLLRLSYAFRGLAKPSTRPVWRRSTRSFIASHVYFDTAGAGPSSASTESAVEPDEAGAAESQDDDTEVDDAGHAGMDFSHLSDGDFEQLMRYLDAQDQLNHQGEHPEPDEQVEPSDSAAFSHDTYSSQPSSPSENLIRSPSQSLISQLGNGPLSASSPSIEAYSSEAGSHEIQPTLDIPPESDPLLAYLTSRLMQNGKRHSAARRTSRMLLHIFALTRSPPLPIFRHAVELAAPSIRIVSQKRGGKIIHKPIALSEKQRTFFAIGWILKAAESDRCKTVEERLAKEVLDIIRQDPGQNKILKKKNDIHTLGMVNRANVKTWGQ